MSEKYLVFYQNYLDQYAVEEFSSLNEAQAYIEENLSSSIYEESNVIITKEVSRRYKELMW